MALDLGELVAYLKLDDSAWDASLDKMPDKLKGKSGLMIGAVAVVGAAVGAALISGINDAMNWEATNDKVAAGLGLTEQESARVGALAGKVYAENYGESVEQVQQTIGGVIDSIKGMGTASDAEVSKMTANVLSYASAFGVETTDAIATVNQLISAGFAEDGPAALDLMTAAMQKVPEALRGDLTDAINEYTPFLASLGLTGEESFDLLVKGAEKGMYGIDKTGDALKEFGIRATDMSALSKTAYDSLGMSQEDMTARLLAGGETAKGAFDEIVAGLQSMEDPTARSQAALALFGTPLEDLSVTDIPKFLAGLQGAGDGMTDVGGKASELSATMGENAKGGMDAMNRQLELIFATVGEQLLPILTQFFAFLAENPAVLQIIVAALAVLALAFIGVTVATWAMNTALLANPITWIILGIVALIAALVLLFMNWDQVTKWISDVWAGFISWVSDVFAGFIGWITGVMDGFFGWWNGIWAAVGSFIESTWNGFVGFITDTWNGFLNWIVSAIVGYVSFWFGIWSSVGSFINNIWSNIVSFAQGAWNNLMSFLGGIPGAIMNVFAGVGNWLWDVGRDLIQGLLDGVASLAGTIGRFFLNLLPDWIVGPFKAALGIHSPSRVFREYGRNTVQGYLEGIEELQPTIDSQMSTLVATPSAAHMRSSAVSAPPAPASSKTINYYAAEHQSLSSEEALFAALGSPRAGGDD